MTALDEASQVLALDVMTREMQTLEPSETGDGDLAVTWGDEELVLELPVKPRGIVVVAYLETGWNSRTKYARGGDVTVIHFHRQGGGKTPTCYLVLDIIGHGDITLIDKNGTEHPLSFNGDGSLTDSGE